MSKIEQFSSRWGIILASLGMAIGAGNIWRFPRLAGQYGGTFIVLWILFLFIWSIPLLLAEFAIGKKFKKGVIGSFASLAGKKYTWLGFFITVCTLGIAFYYSIVTAWSLQYLGISITNMLDPLFLEPSLSEKIAQDPAYLTTQWDAIANGNWLTVALYIIVVMIGTYLLVKGVKKGLERANKVLIPSLFMLLVIIAFTALNMKNGMKGLEYMFSIDFSLFSNPTVWIEALSQSAWSTGAGWGLMMTISAYSRSNEEVTLNTFVGAFGNNTASLLAGMAILPAVFALSASDAEAISYLQTGNQALTFTIIPKLFASIPGGSFLSIIFFLALFLAAFSSLLPMIELFTKNLMDLGITRKKSVSRVILFFILFGLPSALSLSYFSNQDWVWGVGLIVTGMFIMFGVVKFGATRFKTELIDGGSDFKIPTKYFTICITANIGVALFLIYWWLSQGYSTFPWFNEYGFWNVFDTYSNASVVTQWGTILLIGYLLNNYLYRKFVIGTQE
ncbi:MAG: sodium-dependent transporter [Cyclobacteriaceae bacterium]|nr:sodium-dependent transporter [Cyclobacteriaceae bacterium]